MPNWSLVFERDPSVIEYAYGTGYARSYGGKWSQYDYDGYGVPDHEPFEMVRNPKAVAKMLAEYWCPQDLMDELYEYGTVSDSSHWLNRWLR